MLFRSKKNLGDLIQKHYADTKNSVQALLKANPKTAMDADNIDILHRKTMEMLASDPLWNKWTNRYNDISSGKDWSGWSSNIAG